MPPAEICFPERKLDPARHVARRQDRQSTARHVGPKAEYDFPPKPKRMRWKTYQRLLDQYDELQNRWGIGMMNMMGRFSSRLKPR